MYGGRMIEVDRKAFLASLGVGALELMDPEEKAEALEHYMLDQIDEAAQQQAPGPRGTGNLLRASEFPLEPMPEKPTLVDFFNLRLAAKSHCLQSATHALRSGYPERTVMACLLHDGVQGLIRADHGWWGAQLYEPYVDERITWGIRYHGALRFYPDPEMSYEYPDLYVRIFGEDYVPPDYIRQAAEFATGHEWYMEARLITVCDLYAFEEGVELTLDPFLEIIERNFAQPSEGLGYDDSPSAHMWRTIANPDKPL
jgi:hypothetical protein